MGNQATYVINCMEEAYAKTEHEQTMANIAQQKTRQIREAVKIENEGLLNKRVITPYLPTTLKTIINQNKSITPNDTIPNPTNNDRDNETFKTMKSQPYTYIKKEHKHTSSFLETLENTR